MAIEIDDLRCYFFFLLFRICYSIFKSVFSVCYFFFGIFLDIEFAPKNFLSTPLFRGVAGAGVVGLAGELRMEQLCLWQLPAGVPSWMALAMGHCLT